MTYRIVVYARCLSILWTPFVCTRNFAEAGPRVPLPPFITEIPRKKN